MCAGGQRSGEVTDGKSTWIRPECGIEHPNGIGIPAQYVACMSLPERTRRWVLRTSGIASALLSGGCLRLAGTDDQQDVSGSTSTPPETERPTATPTADIRASSGWETATDGDADVGVNSPTNLDFRVFKCANASATRSYETRTPEVTISFDYEVEVEQWFEAPYLIVRSGGATVYESENIGVDDKTFQVKSYETTGGSFERTVSAADSFTIELGIRPSNVCSNSDHANTYFRVDGLTVE